MAQTLENLVAKYRWSVADPSLSGKEIELEVRFLRVDFPIFSTILGALVEKKTDLRTDSGVIVHTVNAIMDEEPRRGGRKGKSLIRQLVFVDGKKAGERYYQKWGLAPPFQVHSPRALSYKVVLSAEETLSELFTSDAGALIRVKCRASFTTSDAWRIDLTVTRSLRGAAAQTALSQIVARMFRAGKMTPANMLTLLDLTDPSSEYREVYDYEIELERLPGAAADVSSSKITALVGSVLQLANPEYLDDALYQAEIFHVAKFFVKAPGVLARYEHEWGLKKLVPQAIALTRGEYKKIYPPVGFFLLDKADGVRAVASVRGGHLLILAKELLRFAAPEGRNVEGSALATVVDGELVQGQQGAKTFHAFDVVAVRGTNLAAAGYEARSERLGEAVEILRAFGVDARPKPVVRLTASEPAGLKEQFHSPVFDGRPYATDGRILVEPGQGYSSTTTFKWKSLWDTTIDFLARRAPSAILGRRPYVDAPGHSLHLLFVGISSDLFEALGLERLPGYGNLFRKRFGNYFPIQFSPSDAPLAYLYQHPLERPRPGSGWEGWTREIDGKVVEMRCATEGANCVTGGVLGTPAWQIVRVRDDRAREMKTLQYFGNDARVAELTWLNYADPLREEELWEGAAAGYFAAPKTSMYQAQTAFTSFVKSRRIEGSLHSASWVIDAAIGKGQDFGRYVQAAVRHVVGIDRDQEALTELVRRKYSHATGSSQKGRRRKGPTTLFVLCADLTDPHSETAAKVRTVPDFPSSPEKPGADALVINLAIHYLAGDIVKLRNFVALCRDLVKIGGTVIITTMFGQQVHDLLAAQKVAEGQSWDSRQDGVLKYSIRRHYSADVLTKAGQRIDVLLPFSDGEYYQEYLVNVDSLVAEFSVRGFSATGETPTFKEYFRDFEIQNPAMFNQLTSDDFTFLGLFGEIVLKRVK